MLSELSCKAHNLIKITFPLLMLLPFTQPAHAAFTIEQVLSEPYFDASDIKKVRKGGFGVAKIHEVSDREIAVVIACLVRGAPEDTLAPFLGDSLPIDEELLEAQQLIDTEFHEKSFTAISLGSDNRDEIQHYLDAKPGYGLNLSSDEISALQALRGADDPDQVEALLEDILLARYLSYRENGLAGAQPYAREKGEDVSPGEELRKTEDDLKGLHELYPDFHNAWLSYPRNMPEDLVGDDFFWVKLNIDERPAFMLSHRLVTNNEDAHLVGIRDYYISHFFDVSQRVAGVFQLESGEYILVYIERAWVDYWSGFVSLSKRIGRKVMKKQMEHLLEDHGICGK
ncbi:MAG: hypothetical protein JRG79_16555 [Deltaproteobacteria bacterium]|nr:hypothetical protein [Deltaproteobacteria bacterium]